jgi:ribosomal protein S18 acetylase RimI-like enzyme
LGKADKMDIRLLRPSDIPHVQLANITNLPENYFCKYYLYHAMSWPQLSYVAVDVSSSFFVIDKRIAGSYLERGGRYGETIDEGERVVSEVERRFNCAWLFGMWSGVERKSAVLKRQPIRIPQPTSTFCHPSRTSQKDVFNAQIHRS